MYNIDNPAQSYDLTTVDDTADAGDDVCTDPWTSFSIQTDYSDYGYCSDRDQGYQFRSFRWSTATAAVESQSIRCTIKLEYEKSTTGILNYNECPMNV